MRLHYIRCDDIRPGRRDGDDGRATIDVLADSVRRHGVLRPVLLRESVGGYVIVHGVRRWRAARMLGLEVIPAFLVQEFTRETHFAA